LRIVVIPHELLDVIGEFLKIPIFMAVDLFLLERFHEAFAERVIPGICRSAHAGDHTVGFELLYIIGAGVLNSPIAVMDNPRWWLALLNGHP